MNANKHSVRWTLVLGLLGAAIVAGAPNSAHADQGKWWSPKQGRHDARGRESYRAPVWGSSRYVRPASRYYRPWNGNRVYRDRVWVGRSRGYRGQSGYGWRYYSAPVYHYPRHVVDVRPIRFFISAGGVIGGVSVHAGYADAGPVYGCNFCDERFSSYHDYEEHVSHCAYAPEGYRVAPQDWESTGWSDSRQHEQGSWQPEDED